MKDLEKMFDVALEIVAQNIGRDKIQTIMRPITINSRAKKRWGRCARIVDGFFKIEISKDILGDSVPNKPVIEVLIHEILHACKGGMSHTGAWKNYANIISKNTDFKITRITSHSVFGIKSIPAPRPYSVKCPMCGFEYHRCRMSKLIKTPEDYYCGRCGCQLSKNDTRQG